MRKLAEAKAYIERRIKEIENELELLKIILILINQALSEKSFIPASTLSRQTVYPKDIEAEIPVEDLQEAKQIYTITSRTGEELAKIYVYDNKLIIKPSMIFHSNTPPFQAFFIKKILEGYKRRDMNRVASGEILEKEAFNYQIMEDEKGVIHEIRIMNYGDKQRLDEIRSALRWTLNKMLVRESS